MEDACIFIVWGVLLLGPPVAIFGFRAVRRSRPNAQARVLLAFAIIFSLVAVSISLRVTMAIRWLNPICLAIAYSAYCYLAATSLRIAHMVARAAVIAIVSPPILAGYALGTIGFMAIPFIVGDLAQPAEHVESVGVGLVCATTNWGMAASDDGYTVHLYRQIPLIPLLQREVASIVVNETHPQKGRETATCGDVLAEYRKLG